MQKNKVLLLQIYRGFKLKFKNKKATSIWIIGLVMFSIMAFLSMLTVSTVEKLQFKEFAGQDAQILTESKYNANFIGNYIEKSIELNLNNRNNFSLFLDNLKKLSASKIGPINEPSYVYISKNSIDLKNEFYQMYLDLYLKDLDLLYESLKTPYILKKTNIINSKIVFEKNIKPQKLDESYILGTFYLKEINSIDTTEVFQKNIPLKIINYNNSNVGKYYFNPSFRIENLDLNFLKFLEYYEDKIIFLKSNCDKISSINHKNYSILFKNETVLVTFKYKNYGFISEFKCKALEKTNQFDSNYFIDYSNSNVPDLSSAINSNDPDNKKDYLKGRIYFTKDELVFITENFLYEKPMIYKNELIYCDYDGITQAGGILLSSSCTSLGENAKIQITINEELWDISKYYINEDYTTKDGKTIDILKLESPLGKIILACDDFIINQNIDNYGSEQIYNTILTFNSNDCFTEYEKIKLELNMK